jgi:hypothetical protein
MQKMNGAFINIVTFDGGPIMKRLPLIVEEHDLVVYKHVPIFGAFEGYKMIVYL